jgi:DNA polymerase-1
MKLVPRDEHRWWRQRYAHRHRIIVDDERSCNQALTLLDKVKAAGFDCETDTTERMHVRPVTAQVSFDNTDILFSPDYVSELKPWIDQRPTMLGFESKFELWALENAGMKWQGPVHDAQITDYLTNENIKDYDLKTRCAAIFKEQKRPDWKELFGHRAKSSDLWADPQKRSLFIDYSLADSADHLRMHDNRREALREWPLRPGDGSNMYDDFYLKTEVPLTSVLYEMERVGALIDVDYLGELHDIAQRTMEDLQRRFFREVQFDKLPKEDKKAAKGDFKGFSDKLMNSPKQLMELFYKPVEEGGLGYPEQYTMSKDKKTGKKTRKPTTNDDALEALAAMDYPAAVLLRDNRAIKTLDGTFLVGLVERADDDHYVHTNFMQAFTATGRLSSRDPNLQNIPRADVDEKMADYMRAIRLGIRGAFIAPKGHVILGGDYGQIETRLMAHLSGDEDMIRACLESDIYSAMAAILFNKPAAFFSKDAKGKWLHAEAGRIRQVVKAIVLGIGFGKQAKSIARDLKITEQKAKRFLQMYFNRFPKFDRWMKRQIKKAKEHGFVRTMTGRYRRLPNIRLPHTQDNWWRIAEAERQALNSPVQGSAYEIMKQSMLNITSSGVCEEHDAKMFLTVHDELLFYVPREEAEAMRPKVEEIMMHPFKQDLSVPLAVSLYSALDWGSGK